VKARLIQTIVPAASVIRMAFAAASMTAVCKFRLDSFRTIVNHRIDASDSSKAMRKIRIVHTSAGTVMSQVQTSLAISATVATATAVKIPGTRIARDLPFDFFPFDFFGGLSTIKAGLGEAAFRVLFSKPYRSILEFRWRLPNRPSICDGIPTRNGLPYGNFAPPIWQ